MKPIKYYYYRIEHTFKNLTYLFLKFDPKKYWDYKGKNHQFVLKYSKAYTYRKKFDFELINVLRELNVKSLIEVGCGYGRVLKRLKSLNMKLVGVDISDTQIVNAKKYLEGLSIPLKLIDGTNLPFNKNSFDAVLSCDSIYYVPNPQIIPLIKEMCRIAKNYVILIEPVFKDKKFSKHIFSYDYPKYFENFGLKTIVNRKLDGGYNLYIFKQN